MKNEEEVFSEEENVSVEDDSNWHLEVNIYTQPIKE